MSASAVDATVTTWEADRITKVSSLMAHAGVGALLVCDAPTMRWLGVEDASSSWLLISDGVGRMVPPTGDGEVGDAPLPSRGSPRIAIPCTPSVGDRHRAELASAIAAARAVKDASELTRICAAAELVETGHRGLRGALEPGLSELDLWDAAARAIAEAGGDPEAAAVDLMVGERTALVGVPPGKARLAGGDPVLFDLAPQREGYWADSCATFVCGDPSTALRHRHQAVEAALERGLECARPGISAGAVDAAIRAALATAGLKCPHHTGHGVGISAQEPPWFLPGNDFVLEQGMVVALEPGGYADGFGVRLEHLAVIEADGARPLTNHPLTLTRER